MLALVGQLLDLEPAERFVHQLVDDGRHAWLLLLLLLALVAFVAEQALLDLGLERLVLLDVDHVLVVVVVVVVMFMLMLMVQCWLLELARGRKRRGRCEHCSCCRSCCC